ncbi:MAG: alpha/beta hydrolase [Sphingomonadales bacterium]|nr:alpha/beta hydrolase [Sphingomonadales bacterium]
MADKSRVAPELRDALDLFPDFTFGEDMTPYRTAFKDRPQPPLSTALAAVPCREVRIPGAPGDPEVRILHYSAPGETRTKRPALLHIHGGGYVIGDPELNDAMNRAAALTHGCEVVSVDYRLAPETRHPGALHDNYAAFQWLHAHADALAIDPARVVLAGESAGGGHAVALALHIRDRAAAGASEPPPCLVLLDSPMLDDRSLSHPACGAFVWTPEKNRFGWRALLGVEPGGDAVPAGAVPARAESVAGLPPHFLTVGALDLFLDECLEWTRRLAREGIAVELHVIPGAYHGFAMVPGSPQVEALTRYRDAALARAFAG